MANEKIKKPKFKKTNITVVDAKTGKKKRKATNTMNLENFMNFINMNYPKGPQTKDPSPAIERNRRQSKKALEIINSRKKAGGGKVYKYKKGTSDKTIIGKNKGMRGSEKPSSLGADKTKGLDPKFSSKVEKQNKQGMKEAANILKQASDQKLNSPPPKNKGLKKLPKNVRNKMGFKKHGGKITYRMSGGQVVGAGYDD